MIPCSCWQKSWYSETYVCDLMFYCSHWFCSVDVSPRLYLVAAGRNHGIVRLMSVILCFIAAIGSAV